MEAKTGLESLLSQINVLHEDFFLYWEAQLVSLKVKISHQDPHVNFESSLGKEQSWTQTQITEEGHHEFNYFMPFAFLRLDGH